ncbi:MAG: hypothetical protein MMC33_002725 [Icmadophila ericetorum]|nr:hypothetical protein [Icmadophila ericetorum]
MSSSESSSTPHPTNHERDPLLGNHKTIDNGTIEAAHSSPTAEDVDDSEDAPLLPDEPTTKQLLVAMSSIWLGSFLAALDVTIIATLSAPISASFHSLQLLSWLASGYLIANAAFQPLSGKLTDIFSRRTGLLFANVFFGVGNLICGLAREEWVMIFGRVVSGVGGGGLHAISTFVASDMIPLRRRGVWQGFGNIMYGVGAALGGVYGGFINDTIGWRWAFLIQVPFVALSTVIVYFTVNIPVKATEKSAWKRIDYLGSFMLIVTLVTLLLGLNSGGNLVPWTHPLVLTTLPLSALLLLGFIYVENNYAAEPVIPVKLLLDRTVLSACFTNFFITISTFGVLFFAPIYFQVLGQSPTRAGAQMAPQSVGVGLGSITTGLVMRWAGKYYLLNISIQTIFTASLILGSTWNLATPTWEHIITVFCCGVGYSGMLTVSLLALISAVEHKHQAVVTSTSYAFRSTAATMGVAIASAVFQNILKIRLWDRVGDRPDAAEIIPKIRDSLEAIKDLPPSWKADVQNAYMDALHGVFLTMLGIAILGGIVSLFMRENKLHNNLSRK